jgi:RNA polymerase sigma-70 factor (ECF subfamily)
MEPQEVALSMDGYAPGRTGELAAFERIVALSERRVVGVALRLLNNRQDAQDAAQEVFLRLYKHWKRLDAARELDPWLYRVTVNVCRDIARKRCSTVAMEDTRELSSAGPDALESAERAQRLEMVRRALGRLGEKERAAVVLRDVEGLSTREVAEILGSSEATVRSQISTARLKLREFTGRWLRGKT